MFISLSKYQYTNFVEGHISPKGAIKNMSEEDKNKINILID